MISQALIKATEAPIYWIPSQAPAWLLASEYYLSASGVKHDW